MSISTHLSRFTATPHPSPLQSLALSQLAPSILNSSASDTPEQWQLYESLLLSTLRTGDDTSARQVLHRLSNRFGRENNRVLALQGLFDEAVAKDTRELELVLRGYETLLKEDPANLPIAKRRITLLSHLNRSQDAITALTFLLSLVPTDAESWAQLAQLYFDLGMYKQTIFCLEEVLLILPNAYNIHARLGEVSYISAEGSGMELPRLEGAVRWYLRSIELCEGYLRGYYGLLLTTSRLSTTKYLTQSNPPPTLKEDVLRKLRTQATTRLQKIVTGYENERKAFAGYEPAEVQAAKELLSKDDVVVG